MELSKCIKDFSSLVQKQEISTFIFKGSSYSSLFFSYFLNKISNDSELDQLQKVDITQDSAALQLQFATSFLGQSCIYWLGDCSQLRQKQKDNWLNFLLEYNGPHKIIAFFDDKVSCQSNNVATVIDIQSQYTFQDVKSIFAHLGDNEDQKTAFFLSKVYKFKRSFSLDELFLLKNYVPVLGSQSSEFYDTWMQKLVVADQSLYTLSQLFFEKKHKDFLRLWFEMREAYSDMFWLSFWSEQVYKAYFFISFTQQGNYAEAKKVSYGLPFAFMKQTWKEYNLAELQNLHQKIYDADCFIKNGGSPYELDKLFVSFFAGKCKA